MAKHFWVENVKLASVQTSTRKSSQTTSATQGFAKPSPPHMPRSTESGKTRKRVAQVALSPLPTLSSGVLGSPPGQRALAGALIPPWPSLERCVLHKCWTRQRPSPAPFSTLAGSSYTLPSSVPLHEMPGLYIQPGAVRTSPRPQPAAEAG